MTPNQHTNQEFMLEVGHGHQIYVHDWGVKTAKQPFIFFLGGPGGQLKDRHRDNFDPAIHRVIFFEQRGCGRSLPYGSLEHNTTADLMGDAVKILDHLKIKKVRAYGSSWGSTLAILFAETYPERVTALVASAIFLGTKEEVDWVDSGHFSPFYPEIWERHLARTPKAHHHDIANYHFKRILGDDPKAAFDSALAVEEMEHSLMALDDRPHAIDPETFDPTAAKLYAHYLSNNCFLPEGKLVKDAHKLTMPVWLVHGRFDMVCPPRAAFALHKAVPHSKLYMAISSHRAEHENWNILRSILAQLG